MRLSPLQLLLSPLLSLAFPQHTVVARSQHQVIMAKSSSTHHDDLGSTRALSPGLRPRRLYWLVFASLLKLIKERLQKGSSEGPHGICSHLCSLQVLNLLANIIISFGKYKEALRRAQVASKSMMTCEETTLRRLPSRTLY